MPMLGLQQCTRDFGPGQLRLEEDKVEEKVEEEVEVAGWISAVPAPHVGSRGGP